jgi:hypothetical protein
MENKMNILEFKKELKSYILVSEGMNLPFFSDIHRPPPTVFPSPSMPENPSPKMPENIIPPFQTSTASPPNPPKNIPKR